MQERNLEICFFFLYFCLQDKLGPFCRSATDCALVLDAIRGKDPDDISSKNINLEDPFSIDISKLTVGYLEDAEMEVCKLLISRST